MSRLVKKQAKKMTIEEMIPFIFRDLLSNSDSFSYLDFYDEVSVSGVKAVIFEELNDENARQFFTGEPSHLHESSPLLTTIRCNFLHIAIWLQRADVVNKLLNEYYINPEVNLEYTHGIGENGYDLSYLGMNDDQLTFTISPLSLAEKTGNTMIMELLSNAMPALNRVVNSVPPMNTVVDSATPATAMNTNGYEADVEERRAPERRPQYKSRLILGDGNFSYARALVKKQQEKGLQHFAAALTITEHASQKTLQTTYTGQETATEFKNFLSNANKLHDQGATLYFGVDAAIIGDDFAGNRYKRIHFNFPYFHRPLLGPAENKSQTRQLVGRFFASAAQLQEPGDRIHMALATGFRDPVWYESATYDVGTFCEQYGYAYISKRKFVEGAIKRYPGYFHVKTASDTIVQTAENGREFIFEKKVAGKIYANSTEKKATSRGVIRPVLKSLDTDSDSSSYVEDSDVEQTNAPRSITL